MMIHKKLAIFDMDGTLFDTSEVNYRAYAAAAKKLGFVIERETFMNLYVGKNYKDFLPLFGIKTESDLHAVHQEKKLQYPSCLAYARINQPLFDVIDTLKERYITVLATTASKKNVLDILNYFRVEEYFDFLITQEDTVRLKPDPECYLQAMQIAGVKAEDTIIFEDSEVGIQAAQASGANVYKVCGF